MEKGLIPLSDDVLALVGTVKVGLGQRCVILRRRYGMTLRDASVATGIHQHRLSEMERGLLRRVAPKYIAYIEKLTKG